MHEYGLFARQPLDDVNQLLANQVELTRSLNKVIAEFNTNEAILVSLLRSARDELLELAARFEAIAEAWRQGQGLQQTSEQQQN
jgi:hypothetical protein